MRKLAIIGASGHGKVIADIAVGNGYEDIVFLDDADHISSCAGFPVVGKTSMLSRMDGDVIVAIGNASVRGRIQESIQSQERLKLVTLIHPNAVISRRVEIGVGSVIMGGAVINSDVVIGKGCIINTGASVDHDCNVGDFAHISVGAHVAGTCRIGKRTWIGAGAVVSNNVNICGDCMIGAGAVVIKKIEKPGTYIGVPAKERTVCKQTKIRGGYCST